MRRFWMLVAALALAMAASAPARCAQPAAAAAPERHSGRIDLKFRSASIDDVFDMLSRKAHVSIILAKGVTGTVTVNLYGVSVREAIYDVAQAAGYWVEVRNGNYIILGKQANLAVPSANTTVRTFRVQYSDPKQVADIVAKYTSRYGKVMSLAGRRLVVVEDLPDVVRRIGKLIRALDVPPKEVMIEAKILQIQLDKSESFGIDWKAIFGPNSAGVTQFASGAAATPTSGFFFSVVNHRLQAYLSALAGEGRVRTLATPKLLALDNHEAKVVIGDSTGYEVTTTINLVTSQTVQFLESGVILDVTPSVDEQGRVLLEVHPEVSSARLNNGIPSKKTTQVTTDLICDNGQSVFIGGLIKRTSNDNRQGVPVLRDLPLVGSLFSSRQNDVSSSETVVIITPYVVHEPKEAETLSEANVKAANTLDAAMRDAGNKLQRPQGRQRIDADKPGTDRLAAGNAAGSAALLADATSLPAPVFDALPVMNAGQTFSGSDGLIRGPAAAKGPGSATPQR